MPAIMSQVPDNKVSLGCGTLILIALIVMIFGRGSDSNKLEREIRDLRSDVRTLNSRSSGVSSNTRSVESDVEKLQKSVDALKQAVDSQRAVIAELRDQVKKLVPAAPVPPVER